jgi:hypothetical protein
VKGLLAAPLLRRPDAVEPGRAAAPLRLLQDREVEPDAGGPKVGASRLAVWHVTDWFEKRGMSDYGQHFADNDIEFSILGDVTYQGLERPRCRFARPSPQDFARDRRV